MTHILGLMTCYNRKEKTVRALKSLIQGNQTIQFSFIVVDDGSTDGTKEELAKLPEVQIVSGSGSMFYSGGMRAAIKEAKKIQKDFDYCLLFNDDVDFWESSIENLCKKDSDIWGYRIHNCCNYIVLFFQIMKILPCRQPLRRFL